MSGADRSKCAVDAGVGSTPVTPAPLDRTRDAPPDADQGKRGPQLVVAGGGKDSPSRVIIELGYAVNRTGALATAAPPGFGVAKGAARRAGAGEPGADRRALSSIDVDQPVDIRRVRSGDWAVGRVGPLRYSTGANGFTPRPALRRAWRNLEPSPGLGQGQAAGCG